MLNDHKSITGISPGYSFLCSAATKEVNRYRNGSVASATQLTHIDHF